MNMARYYVFVILCGGYGAQDIGAVRAFAIPPNHLVLTGIDHHENILTIIRGTFSKFYGHARSPFVLAALIDILTDALESSVQFGKQGGWQPR
jgi:hypothetical protein